MGEIPFQQFGFTFIGLADGHPFAVILTGMKAHMLWYPGQKPQKKP
ncbi:deoxyxylulose-5-phosphate synthase [Roseovarius sp. MBR-78]|jgi:deoxyxylulose-5-phosphate synthase